MAWYIFFWSPSIQQASLSLAKWQIQNKSKFTKKNKVQDESVPNLHFAPESMGLSYYLTNEFRTWVISLPWRTNEGYLSFYQQSSWQTNNASPMVLYVDRSCLPRDIWMLWTQSQRSLLKQIRISRDGAYIGKFSNTATWRCPCQTHCGVSSWEECYQRLKNLWTCLASPKKGGRHPGSCFRTFILPPRTQQLQRLIPCMMGTR